MVATSSSLPRLLVACAGLLALAGCQTASQPSDGLERRIVSLEYKPMPSRSHIATALVEAARSCWIGKDPAFAGLAVSPVEPRAEPDAYRFTFKDPKKPTRVATVNVVSPRAGSDSGWAVQVVQNSAEVDIQAVLRGAMFKIERGQPVC